MEQSQPGIGIGALLFVTLIVLKIMGYVTMSWFWVISSIIWIPLGIIAVVMAFVLAIASIMIVVGLAAAMFSK